DPRTREMIGGLWRRTSEATLRAERLLDESDPKLMIFVERSYADRGPLSDIAPARGANVVQLVSAPQDDALVFKRYTSETRAMHPRSLSDESWRLVKEMPWGDAEEHALDAEFARRY